MAHLSSLGLENFRTFRERATFNFAPLTNRKGTFVRAWHGDKRNRLFGTAINDSLGASE